MTHRTQLNTFLFFSCLLLGINPISGQDAPIWILPGGNTWSSTRSNHVTRDGISGWTDPAEKFITRVRITRTDSLHILLKTASNNGSSKLRITLNGISHDVEATGSGSNIYDAGSWYIRDSGYQAITLEAISSTSGHFPDIQSIGLEGPAMKGPLAYVPNNEGNFFYWGKRGPSVHLNYTLPADFNAAWFYNEVTVPEGLDHEGSYFMADGFKYGYFGMQVNGPAERHILFSVWSPFQTDNPGAIPDSQKIVLAAKGEGVHAGEFGNEGAGGQSYLNYMWKAGNTYRFLLRAQPLSGNYTQFTAWFYAPEKGSWMLIASFKRPQTKGWLTNLHSFLENFEPSQGELQRIVSFNHQWARDDKGNWLSLNKARFTVDNTGRKGYRMDYGGGVKNGAFYLRNCGFFSGYTIPNTILERPADEPGNKPDVELDKLPW